MIERINEVAENTPTNTGVFAASFEVLNSILTEGLEDALSKTAFSRKKRNDLRAKRENGVKLQRMRQAKAAPCSSECRGEEPRRAWISQATK